VRGEVIMKGEEYELTQDEATKEELKQAVQRYNDMKKKVDDTYARKKKSAENAWQMQMIDDQVSNPKRF